jgi:tryptophan 2,3-dioxygenase
MMLKNFMRCFGHHRQAVILGCVMVALLTMNGCAIDGNRAPINREVATPAAPQISAADELMAELMRLQAMPAAELVSVRDAARDAFERDPAPFRRTRYMLALHASPASATDDERLLMLVEPIVAAPLASANASTNAATAALALTIQQAALSRKRLREEIAATRTRAANAANSRRDDREPEIRALKTKIEDLEKQLAALKSIERSVTRR